MNDDPLLNEVIQKISIDANYLVNNIPPEMRSKLQSYDRHALWNIVAFCLSLMLDRHCSGDFLEKFVSEAVPKVAHLWYTRTGLTLSEEGIGQMSDALWEVLNTQIRNPGKT